MSRPVRIGSGAGRPSESHVTNRAQAPMDGAWLLNVQCCRGWWQGWCQHRVIYAERRFRSQGEAGPERYGKPMSYPRFLPDGGGQVPQEYERDPEVADAQHRPDVMEQLIADHQQQSDRMRDLGEPGDRQPVGPLRRLVARQTRGRPRPR
jgi:hypothetical protein